MKKKRLFRKFPLPLLDAVQCPACGMPLMNLDCGGYACGEGLDHTAIIPPDVIQDRLVKSFYTWAANDPRNPMVSAWCRKKLRLGLIYRRFQKRIFSENP